MPYLRTSAKYDEASQRAKLCERKFTHNLQLLDCSKLFARKQQLRNFCCINYVRLSHRVFNDAAENSVEKLGGKVTLRQLCCASSLSLYEDMDFQEL